jgi:hypothetical protein
VIKVEAKGAREPDQIQAVYLEKLADELSHRGLEAGCGKDGMWWFWWSWAERIAVADDVDLAATTIVRVLASHLRPD